MRVLVSDIGGTNARFAMAELARGERLLRDSVREYPAAGFASAADAARHFLDELGERADAAVFAVAGRVRREEARITNHPWQIRAPEIGSALGTPRVALINDFAAQAMAISRLGADDVVAVGAVGWPGFDMGAAQTYAVIGPGTGLGVGGLLVRNGRCFALETEGGHAGFAPSRPRDMQVLECLMRRFGRVSCERLVSGPGLANLYAAVCEIEGVAAQAWSPAQINAQAAAGDARCARAVELFCAAFGSMAGDLVLTLGAWDGVFLAGGVVPKLLGALQRDSFRAAFEAKGRFAPAMAEVPALAVVHACSGLLGAAAHAAETYDSALAV
ncbi:glucokinase [Lysobacter sp. yr284]|uniref:glucokinase n=1 Tax=Lysobacter sp. yr284 TaxID=1761791 RepID=UPI00089B22E9|nr:glucokinase [Lysobacter sp. yr284]SDY35316.1 glucokinase [Lysobacter sp. yr284]